MSVIIFRLKDVPEDEADEVRELLRENNLDFYETSEGKWRISLAAIWLKDDAEKERARALIDEYQENKVNEVREYHEKLREQGQLESFFSRLVNYPLQIVIYIILVLLVIYFTVFPFINL